MLKNNLEILKIINSNSDITQRQISQISNLSLGKVNSIIKNLELDNIIKIERYKNRYRYIVLKKGIDLLENTIIRFNKEKINIHNTKNVKINTAVILAAGYNSSFSTPIPLLKIHNIPLIEIIIQSLINNNISNIVVVAGYKHELFNYLKLKYNINLCFNLNYLKTGTMTSLYKSIQYINEDFILIESDLFFKDISNVISKILYSNNRDCIVLSNIKENTSDTVYVEIKDNYLYKITKDIHQLTKIDGELVGICKISYELFNKMKTIFEKSSNPYLNYEYVLLDISRNYNIGFEVINGLEWQLIDTIPDYTYVYNILSKNKEF